jgi:hypothetical protein
VYGKYERTQQMLANPAQATQEEIAKLTGFISQFMELPVGETPTLATVSNIEQLKGQPFFANAKNGDKVLIYQKALKAVLYRPSTKKVIEVSVYQPPQILKVTNTSATPTSKPLEIALRNGTTISGLTATFEKNLLLKIPNAEIVSKDTSKVQSYKYSMVIDLTGKHKEQTAELANSLNIAVGELPDKEATVSADYLIILGTDVAK